MDKVTNILKIIGLFMLFGIASFILGTYIFPKNTEFFKSGLWQGLFFGGLILYTILTHKTEGKA